MGGFFFNIGNVAKAGLGSMCCLGISRKRGDYIASSGNYRVPSRNALVVMGSDSPGLSSC